MEEIKTGMGLGTRKAEHERSQEPQVGFYVLYLNEDTYF